MANVFAKSGREKSVFYVGAIKLSDKFIDTGLSNAEFKAHKVLSEAVDRGLVLIGLAQDDEPEIIDTPASNDTDGDNDGLPDDKASLVEIAESYGLDFNAQLGAKKLKALITAHIAEQE